MSTGLSWESLLTGITEGESSIHEMYDLWLFPLGPLYQISDWIQHSSTPRGDHSLISISSAAFEGTGIEKQYPMFVSGEGGKTWDYVGQADATIPQWYLRTWAEVLPASLILEHTGGLHSVIIHPYHHSLHTPHQDLWHSAVPELTIRSLEMYTKNF